jgi:hypothetical protein
MAARTFSELFEVARVLVHLDHVASSIVHANNGVMLATAKLGVVDCVADRV